MGQYARAYTLARGDSNLNEHSADGDPLELYQSYDAFAVLTGVRNYCSIVPLLDIERPWPAFMTDMKKSEQWENMFYNYRPYAWFTPEELNALDLDRPLEFLERKTVLREHQKHRLESVQPGDTYRSFIARETNLLAWFDAIREADPEFVVITYD